MSCRTQGGISRRPSFRPSVRPPPLASILLSQAWFWSDFGLIWALWAIRIGCIALSDLNLALETLNQLSIPHICPPDLKLALHTPNPPSRPHISSLGLKFVLWASSLPLKPQIYSLKPNSALQASNPPLMTSIHLLRPNIPQDVSKFPPVSYRTSALWGRCPALSPLLHLITPSRASGTADHVRSLDD